MIEIEITTDPPRDPMEESLPPQQNYGDRMPMNNAPGGHGNCQGDRRRPMPSYQGNYNQGETTNLNPPGQTGFSQRDQRSYSRPEQSVFGGEGRTFAALQVGNYRQGRGSYNQGTNGNYGQGTIGLFGQGGGESYGHGTGGQYGEGGGGSFQQGTSGNHGQGTCGDYDQGTSGDYDQGTSGQYSQGGWNLWNAELWRSWWSTWARNWVWLQSEFITICRIFKFSTSGATNNMQGQQGSYAFMEETGNNQGKYQQIQVLTKIIGPDRIT